MRNIGTELDEAGVSRIVTQREHTVGVTQQVVVRRQPYHGAEHLLHDDVSQWDWRALRDYVVTEIERRHGAWARDERKEYGIFSSFLARWGDQAVLIARSAFEAHDGMWNGEPISINRFCKAADLHFAKPLAERLSKEPVAGW